MNKKEYLKMVSDIARDTQGINTSEGFLLVEEIAKKNPKTIIESGRASGYSTLILARAFPDKKIVSIDFDRYSKASKLSEKRLKNYKNVILEYGDTREIIWRYISGDTYVFIDGPKGHEAIILAARLFQDKRVAGIAMHDFGKEEFFSDILERIFSKIKRSYELLSNDDVNRLDNPTNKIKDQDNSMVFIDHETSLLNVDALKRYSSWFNKIRPFYTRYTYKMKPGIFRKTFGMLSSVRKDRKREG